MDYRGKNSPETEQTGVKKMRITSILVAIALSFFSTFAFAESIDALKKNIVHDQKKLVILENLTLTD
ncbi:MAG: hypothetical protein U1D97_01130, partial [Desulfuromonadales bacterium]|nr:hypothetical protein [Desulfuromonadales bacterium]